MFPAFYFLPLLLVMHASARYVFPTHSLHLTTCPYAVSDTDLDFVAYPFAPQLQKCVPLDQLLLREDDGLLVHLILFYHIYSSYLILFILFDTFNTALTLCLLHIGAIGARLPVIKRLHVF